MIIFKFTCFCVIYFPMYTHRIDVEIVMGFIFLEVHTEGQLLGLEQLLSTEKGTVEVLQRLWLFLIFHKTPPNLFTIFKKCLKTILTHLQYTIQLALIYYSSFYYLKYFLYFIQKKNMLIFSRTTIYIDISEIIKRMSKTAEVKKENNTLRLICSIRKYKMLKR